MQASALNHNDYFISSEAVISNKHASLYSKLADTRLSLGRVTGFGEPRVVRLASSPLQDEHCQQGQGHKVSRRRFRGVLDA